MKTARVEAHRARATVLLFHALVLATVLVGVELVRIGAAGDAAVAGFAFDRGYEDFDKAYYRAGQLIRERPADLYAWRAYGGTEAPALDSTTAGYYVNIPILAWLFAPFSLLSIRIAGDLFLVLNVIVSVASLVLLQQRIGSVAPMLRWLLTAAFVTSGPLQSALHLGQTTPAVLLALILAERCLLSGREATAGIWLAFACLLKVPTLVLLPYFAWWRRRLALVAGAVTATTVLVSLAAYGWHLHVGYFDAAFADYVGAALPSHGSQSIASVVARLTTDAPLWSWIPVPLGAGARRAHATLVIAILAVTAGALYHVRKNASHEVAVLSASLVLCAALLVMPVYWTHYGMWLLPVAVAAAGTGRERPTTRSLVLIGSAILLVNIPVLPRSLIEHASEATWFRLFISHQAAGTLILLGACAWRLLRLPVRGAHATEA